MSTQVQDPSPAVTYKHAYLLACLLLVIGVSPFLEGNAAWALQGMLFATLVAAAYATATSTRLAICLGGLATLSVLAQIAYGTEPAREELLYGFLLGYILFFSIVVWLLTRSLFRRQERITADTICGAAAVYLIFGLLWAMAYSLLEMSEAGSFVFGGEEISPERFERFLGFSYTTLTTLGYGNVAPATPRADALATMEAIVGQLYLAVIIARFVALQIVQASEDPPNRE